MSDTILVTGGAGFVGSSLSILLKKDHPSSRVVAFDNLKRKGSELNLPRLRQAGVEFVHGDIRNPEDLAAAGGMSLVVDCAAEPSVLAGFNGSPSYVIRTNLDGTINTLEHARTHRAEVVFLSTSRVYPIRHLTSLKYIEDKQRFKLCAEQPVQGASDWGISESFPLEGARSMYGATKLASELLIAEYCEMYGLRAVINRCGVLTGPWQMGRVDQGVVVLWVARHILGGNLSYIGYGGEGKQVRDILHINDLYDLLRIQVASISKYSGKTFNVGGGSACSVSLSELTRLCQEITGRSISIDSQPQTRTADIPLYLSDCREVMKATGWKPTHTPAQIIQEVSSWIYENREHLAPILN